MPGSVLVLLVHPALQRSRANRVLIDAVNGLDGVTVHDLYDAYPDFMLDVEREQALLRGHEALVFQHPMFWYSAPAHLKEWFDLVLTHGFAYGLAGMAIRDKPWLHTLTTGGQEEAYAAGGANGYAIHDFLRPFEMTARLCGARWQPPLVVYGSRTIDDAALLAHAAQYRARVLALRDGRPPPGDGTWG